MELALASFMTTIGFSTAEIFKMLLLVGFSFLFQGFVFWRIGKYVIKNWGPQIKEFYTKFMTTMDSLPKLQGSVADLNDTMVDQNKKFQEHIEQAAAKDQAMARDIKDLQEKVEQVRYLTTTLQDKKALNEKH